jgi:hypothetical protein
MSPESSWLSGRSCRKENIESSECLLSAEEAKQRRKLGREGKGTVRQSLKSDGKVCGGKGLEPCLSAHSPSTLMLAAEFRPLFLPGKTPIWWPEVSTLWRMTLLQTNQCLITFKAQHEEIQSCLRLAGTTSSQGGATELPARQQLCAFGLFHKEKEIGGKVNPETPRSIL